MELEFLKVSGFERGILCSLLIDAYSFDERYRRHFERDWLAFDDFFFDNPDIADKYGFITALDGVPIGHISWDPRSIPEYVELGHNCIATAFKGKGYGKAQLIEALRRIGHCAGLKKIIVSTNRGLVAAHNYESAGFRLVKTVTPSLPGTFPGETLFYELELPV